MANPGTDRASRMQGLRRFAVAITALNVLGHTILGFEQSPIQPIAAILAAYFTEIVLDTANAWSTGSKRRFRGGLRDRIDFLLSAHISGLAVAMLLYANARIMAVVFAAVCAIASKSLLRLGSPSRHVLNPSNAGITITLLLFPWVGIAPPYQFTENLHGAANWVLPAIIIGTGSFLNARFTGRVPLIIAWVGAFLVQAIVRSMWFDVPFAAVFLPMTGVAFLLFSFYMITDPATTPSSRLGQILFGVAVGGVYGVITALHIVFGLFFSLSIVCCGRALLISAAERSRAARTVEAYPIPAPKRAAVAAFLTTRRGEG